MSGHMYQTQLAAGTELTRLRLAYVSHAFRRTFDINVSAFLSKCSHDHAGPSEMGDELEGLEHSKFEWDLETFSS